MTATVCNVPGCPDLAVHRGRCRRHRQSEAARGYGREHRLDRRVNRPGARCEACGCTSNLQRNHRIPVSMGGTEDPSNKNWLCDCVEHRCHSRLGLKSSTRIAS